MPSPATHLITFYHDIEQNFGIKVDPEACRQMVSEFLRIERQYGISATYNVVGKVYLEKPELIDQITKVGHEVAFHSYSHTYEPENYPNEIALCRQLSPTINGYRSPRSQWNEFTLEALWRNGFLWSAENDTACEPYFIHKGLVRLPIAADDWAVQINEMSEDQWVQSFADLIGKRRYFAFGNHDCAASLKPEARLKAYEKVIQVALQRKALIVNCSEAADLFRRAAVAKYYNQTAKDWNDANRELYRTKKFKELIRSEAQKLNEPVIADLGSAGGLLTAQLSDIAKRIYCIDNAPGMVRCLTKNRVVKAQIGDVTNSGLPDNYVDYVIATRVVEYLFWPDQLANEIKRIGKLGAQYLLSFPAARKSSVYVGETPPDRIRRYFAAQEVKGWTEQIGPGRLIGIFQNEEADAGAQADPTKYEVHNWIYIGEIQNKNPSHSTVRIKHIPLSDFAFELRNHQRDAYVKSFAKYVPAFVRKILRQLPYFKNL
jgi:SAM-dependent methyltransferase